MLAARVLNIPNRLYSMATTMPVDSAYGETMRQKFRAILSHLRGMHAHPEIHLFPQCEHPQPTNVMPLDDGEYVRLAK